MVNNLLHTINQRIAGIIELPGIAQFGPSLSVERNGDIIQKTTGADGESLEVNPNSFGAMFWKVNDQSFSQDDSYGKGVSQATISADLYIISGKGCPFSFPSIIATKLDPYFRSEGGHLWTTATAEIETAQFGPNQLNGLFTTNVTNRFQAKDITRISFSIHTKICYQC